MGQMTTFDTEGVGNLIQLVHRSGKPFTHQMELFRDSWLNGATKFVLDIDSQSLTREHFRSARRVVWDDGSGMSKETLERVYVKIGVHNTAHRSPYLGADPDEEIHGRFGMGGRASTLAFSRYGVVTVTAHEGESLMVWAYLDMDGHLQNRYLPIFDEDGSFIDRAVAVPPYVEPEWVPYEDDPDFSKMLESQGMDVAEFEGDLYIRNPEAGLDWRQVLTGEGLLSSSQKGYPGGIADRVEEVDGKVMAYKGDELAHGTAKVLLGNGLTSHTAVEGDPHFPTEAQSDRYASAIKDLLWETPRSMVTGDPINIYSVTLFNRGTQGGATDEWTTYPLSVLDPETGQAKTVDKAVDFRVVMAAKEHHLGLNGEHLLHFEEGIPVDNAGTEVSVYVLKEDAPGIGTSWSQTGRKGFISVVYNNELAVRTDHPSTYRKFGIPTGTKNRLRDRVFFIFHPPLADHRTTPRTPGVYNDASRAGLVWTGEGTLDSEKYADWANEYLRREPEWMKELKVLPDATLDTAIDDPEFRREMSRLWKKVSQLSRVSIIPDTGSRRTKRGKKGMVTVGVEAVVEAEDGETPFDPIKGKNTGGGGSTKEGDKEIRPKRGVESEDGKLKGRKDGSTIKVMTEAPAQRKGKSQQADLDPPELNTYTFDKEEAEFIFTWETGPGDSDVKKSAGVINMNIDRDAVIGWVDTWDAIGKGLQPAPDLGHRYLVTRIGEYVRDFADREPKDIVEKIISIYYQTAAQQVMVVIAHYRTKSSPLPVAKIKEDFLTPQALTTGAMAQVDMDRVVRRVLGSLPLRAVEEAS